MYSSGVRLSIVFSMPWQGVTSGLVASIPLEESLRGTYDGIRGILSTDIRKEAKR
jgi:hypothetical protein